MIEPEHLQQALLNEYLDRSLEVGQQELVERHLESCAICRARLEELRGLFIALETLPESHLGRDLSVAVIAQLRRQPEKRVSTWLNLAFILQVIAAVAILAFTWPVIFQGLPEISLNATVGPFALSLIGISQFLSIETSQIFQATQQFWNQSLAWMAQLFSVDQSAIRVWIGCLGALSILWLAANGLLLKPQKNNLKRRNS